VFFIGSIRAKKLFYFSATNPKLPLGGFACDSKYFITSKIPIEFRPKTILILKSEAASVMLNKLKSIDIYIPLFVKPDIGEGGFIVKKINSIIELLTYHENHATDYLIQEFINYPIELSVLVHNADGNLKISSITERKYLTIKGDGIHNLKQILLMNDDVKYRINKVLDYCKEELHIVLEKDKIYQPIAIGNNAYGANCVERTEILTNGLVIIFNKINTEVGLFNYARYDIKCKSVSDFLSGNMKILEINGVKGAPIHIFDNKYNLGQAYSEIFRHWGFILKISKKNLSHGEPCANMLEGFNMLLRHHRTKKHSLNKRNIYEQT